MFDCANVEMREQLPELLHGKLDPTTRSAVEAHVASCAECAAELELMRAARGAFSRAPVIDTAKIVANLPRAVARRRWPSTQWQVAAGLTIIMLGGLSLAIARDSYRRQDSLGRPVPVVVDTVRTARADSPAVAPRETLKLAPQELAMARPSITFGGGVSDLSDAEVEALLGALDRLDTSPSEEPDRVDRIVPIDTAAGRGGAAE